MKKINSGIIVFLLFILLILALTYPLAFNLNSSFPGYFTTDEPYNVLWEFWWQKFSFQRHLSDGHCPLLGVPFGANLSDKNDIVYSYSLWKSINRVLSVLTNEILAYNLEILISFLLAMIFMYLLVYALTQNVAAGIFSAICYGFSPFHFARSWQHLGLAQIQWMPLCFIFLFKLKEKKSFKYAIFLGMALFLVASFDYQYAFFMLVALILFVIYSYFQEGKNANRVSALVGGSVLLWFLFTLPVIAPVLKTIFSKETSLETAMIHGQIRNFSDLFAQSARPLSYFLPAVVHPIFGRITEGFLGSPIYGTSLTEHTLYLGWTAIVLAFLAFKRGFKLRRLADNKTEKYAIGFFALLALTAWFFSQPPWWKWGPLKIYMPSFFTYKILPMFRAYCRFGILVMLAFSVLAGFGVKALTQKLKNKIAQWFLAVLLCGMLLFEFWNFPPFKVIDVSRVPQVYSWLKDQGQDTVIAEYPLDARTPNEMYKFYQTRHHLRMINGAKPGSIAHKVAQTITQLSVLRTAQELKGMGVRYVLVHKDAYLNTELIENIEELDRIPNNPGLNFVRSFTEEKCRNSKILCTQKTGPIDVYEVIATPVEPKID